MCYAWWCPQETLLRVGMCKKHHVISSSQLRTGKYSEEELFDILEFGIFFSLLRQSQIAHAHSDASTGQLDSILLTEPLKPGDQTFGNLGHSSVQKFVSVLRPSAPEKAPKSLVANRSLSDSDQPARLLRNTLKTQRQPPSSFTKLGSKGLAPQRLRPPARFLPTL